MAEDLRSAELEVISVGIDCPHCGCEYTRTIDGNGNGVFYLEDFAMLPQRLACERCAERFAKPAVPFWGGRDAGNG